MDKPTPPRKAVPPTTDTPPSQVWMDVLMVNDPLRVDVTDDAYKSTLKLMVRGGMRIGHLITTYGSGSPEVQSALQRWSDIIRKNAENKDKIHSEF